MTVIADYRHRLSNGRVVPMAFDKDGPDSFRITSKKDGLQFEGPSIESVLYAASLHYETELREPVANQR